MSVEELEYLVRYPRQAEVLVQTDPFSQAYPLEHVDTDAALITDPLDPRMPHFAAVTIDRHTITKVFLEGPDSA
jgi:hypothetical protein